jgi:hypothetical protein
LQYPTIPNAPLPADGNGSDSFSNYLLGGLLVGVPAWLTWQLSGGFKTWVFFASCFSLPILGSFWIITSEYAPRKTEKARLPGRPIEHYLSFRKQEDRETYRGGKKIPMETFYEMYFNGDVTFNMDALEALEYRHDWCNFRFTFGLIKHFLFGMLPELIMHTRSQGKSLSHLLPVLPGTTMSLYLH